MRSTAHAQCAVFDGECLLMCIRGSLEVLILGRRMCLMWWNVWIALGYIRSRPIDKARQCAPEVAVEHQWNVRLVA